jgi:hypothetical protein
VPFSTTTIVDNVDEQSISKSYDVIVDNTDDDFNREDDDDDGVDGNGIGFNDDTIRSI